MEQLLVHVPEVYYYQLKDYRIADNSTEELYMRKTLLKTMISCHSKTNESEDRIYSPRTIGLFYSKHTTKRIQLQVDSHLTSNYYVYNWIWLIDVKEETMTDLRVTTGLLLINKCFHYNTINPGFFFYSLITVKN